MIRTVSDWISGFLAGLRETDADRLRAAIGIDVSGPEFFDLYPSRADIEARLRGLNLFREDAIGWLTNSAHDDISNSAVVRFAVQRIVRSGTLLGREEVKALGFYPSKKLGDRFVQAVSGNDLRTATERLEQSLHVAVSRASQLHNLRRMQETGCTEVDFRSANDERSTALERELEGQRLTIVQAREIVLDRSDEISRSTFLAVIDF